MQFPKIPLFLALMALLPGCIFIDGRPYGMNWGHDDAIQGSGHEADEERPVSDFSAVQLQLPANVLVVVGEPTSITLTGDDNLLALVETEVRGGKLVIDAERGKNLRFRRGLIVRIGTPDLASFEVEGSGDVEIRNLERDSFHVSIEGSGDVIASGSVDYLDVSIEGSGDMRLHELAAREAKVSIEGSGDIRVSVADSLRYKIEGSGDIRYDGSPHVSGGIEGSGSVRGR
jgi:hypothetical protein